MKQQRYRRFVLSGVAKQYVDETQNLVVLFSRRKVRSHHDLPRSKETSSWKLKRCSVLPGLRQDGIVRISVESTSGRCGMLSWSRVVLGRRCEKYFFLVSSVFFSYCWPTTLEPARPHLNVIKSLLDDLDDPVPPKQNEPSVQWRIVGLVLTCIALGFATRWLVNLASEHYGYSRGGIFVQAVVCGLLMLLGLWLVLHRIGVSWRMLGGLAGIIFSSALLSNGYPTDFRRLTTLMCIFFPLCAIVTHWFIHCYWKAEVKNIDEIQESGKEAFQFSIRHLFSLSAFVGCVLAFANIVRAEDLGAEWSFQWGALSIAYKSLLSAFVMSFTFLLIAISTIWATLGMANPMPRLILVVAITFCLGLLCPYVRGEDLDQFPSWIAANLLTTTLVTGALLVVRSRGTRLVRRFR